MDETLGLLSGEKACAGVCVVEVPLFSGAYSGRRDSLGDLCDEYIVARLLYSSNGPRQLSWPESSTGGSSEPGCTRFALCPLRCTGNQDDGS